MTEAGERDVTVVYRDDETRLGYWRSVAFMVFLGRITRPRIEGAHELMDALLARDGAFVALSVIPKLSVSSLGMDEPVRRRHTELYQKVAGRVLANAIAVETPGFAAAFVRSIISGTLLLTRSPVPTRIFNARGPAASWLVDRIRQQDPTLKIAVLLEKLGTLTSDVRAR